MAVKNQAKLNAQIVTSLDALYAHGEALEAVAGLMEACGEAESGILCPELVGHTGTLLLGELRRMRAELGRMGKLIQK